MKKKLVLIGTFLFLVGGIIGCQNKIPQASTSEPQVTDSLSPTQGPTSIPPSGMNAELSDENFVRVLDQYAANEDTLGYNKVKWGMEKEFPIIHITTLDEQKILSRDEYVVSVIDVFNCDEAYTLSATAGVKVRGNSTADQGEEKPYRIKFTQKQSMLGLNESQAYKSWVLLRSYWNLAPDYTAFQLANVILGDDYYHSDCAYVNLFINGKSCGVYLLCEQTQANEGRIEVHEPKKDENQTEIGYLLELDNYAGDDPYITLLPGEAEFTDIEGNTRTFLDKNYSIKSKIRSDEQQNFIDRYLNGVYQILREAVENEAILMFDEHFQVVDGTSLYHYPEEAVGAVIDLKSLANMLILEEICQNYDVGEGSHYLAIDFSPESKYQKLTFLGPWDFNWAYSEDAKKNYYACTFQKENHGDRSNVWYITAMKAPWFSALVKERYKEFSDSKALTMVTAQIAKDLEPLRKELGDEESWKVDCGLQIVDFVNTRIEYLNKKWLAAE